MVASTPWRPRASKPKPPSNLRGMPHLSPGDVAPEFSLLDQSGSPVALADFKGRKVLLYFYPKADTPG